MKQHYIIYLNSSGVLLFPSEALGESDEVCTKRKKLDLVPRNGGNVENFNCKEGVKNEEYDNSLKKRKQLLPRSCFFNGYFGSCNCACIAIRRSLLSHSPSAFRWIMTLKGPLSALARKIFSVSYNMKEREIYTDLHVFLPGNGGPHAIFLPRQKRHARGGFFSGKFLDGKELRPIDGDFAEFRRNSVGGGVVWRGVRSDVLDGLIYDWSSSFGESG